MNIIYFTMKKLNENRAFLAMLGFLFVFSCKDSGNGNGDATKYTLTITKPTGGTITSNAGGINCGSKDTTCEAEFSKDSKVTLTAKTDTGYMPTAWQGACDKTKADQPCKLSMDANKSAGKAFLAKPTLAIDPKPINGTLVSNPVGINCGSRDNDCEVEFDKVVEVTLTAMADTGYAPAAWQGACDETATGQPCKLTMNANQTAGRMFGIDTDEDGDPDITDPDDDGDGTDDVTDVDDDNDGLIEIHNLDMFNHIRYNLAGTSYKTSFSIADNRTGGPSASTVNCQTATRNAYLCGYELTKDLDFAEGASYAGSSVNAAWRPNLQADAGGIATGPSAALNAGFVGATDFAGLLEGNGYTISNLYSRSRASSAVSIGLFARTTATATIRNVGIVNAHIYGNTTGADFIGSLAGSNSGLILTSYATGGTVNGGSSGGVSSQDRLGGLVGQNNGGTIIASYATGAVNGFAPSFDYVGGLVGINVSVGGSGGSIIACYAMGRSRGSTQDFDEVGGLVGRNSSTLGAVGSITASYATEAVNADGGGGSDRVGSLVGANFGGVRAGTVTASYGFGSRSNGVGNDHHDGTAKPDGVTSANGLTATNVDAKWNDAAEKTLNAWDFGTASQAPALRYADYDGDGGVDYCDMFPKAIPGTNIPLICGKSLLPGQGR